MLFLPAVLLCLVVLVILIIVPIKGGRDSWGALALYAGAVAAVIFFTVRGWVYWKRSWRYEISDRHLAADRLFGRRRIEMPWSEIRHVRRVTQRDRLRNWPEIEVGALDGQTLIIPTNMSGYQELVEAIRSRATKCEEFDAHPAWRFGE